MVKNNITPKRYASEHRTFLVRTAAGVNVQVRFFGANGSTNTHNMFFYEIGWYPQIPGGTEYRESIHCKTSVRADIMAELDRVMKKSNNPSYSILQERYEILLEYTPYKVVSFNTVGTPGQGQVQCTISAGSSNSSVRTMTVDISKRDQLLSQFKDIYADLYIRLDFPEENTPIAKALKGRQHKIDITSLQYYFVFNSPITSKEVWVKLSWVFIIDYNDLVVELDHTTIDVGTLRENAESPYGLYLDILPDAKRWTVEITCSPTNKKEVTRAVKRCLSEAGIPVTSLIRMRIDVEMTDFRHKLRLRFTGEPGQGELTILPSGYFQYYAGHADLDIKDFDKVIAFAKRIFVLDEKITKGKISEEERMEYFELYNPDDDF